MFDKDQLISQIGAAIVQDDEYRDLNWDGIAIIYNLANGRRGYSGYIYREPDFWEASGPKDGDRAILKTMMALQSAMEQETGKKWLKALVQINRLDQSVNITFEYDDERRWQAGPANYEAIAMEVKP